MAINEALAEYLALYHKGEVNAVTSRELECSFQMRGSELRREINALRGDGIPICSFEGGYYYAATAEELERTIRQLRSRIKRLWIINKMAPDHYSRFIDVFGGSGTVTMSRPIQQGCMEVYNDFNSNLTNLFCCVKNRPLALLAELGFLPLNTRDDFNVLYKFLSKGEITDDYLQDEMELTEILLKPPEAEAIRTLLLERAPRGDVRRAADFFKLVRYSFSGSSKSFGGKPCDIRRFFHLIWECSRRLANVIVENKDFEDVIRQYDRGDAWIYCDPPYFEAECYEVAFPKENHQRLHDTLLNCQGYVMVSYNYCPYICELYHEFYIFRVVRPNSMSQTAGSEYEEVIITNYDPRKACWQLSLESLLNCGSEARYELIHEPERPIKTTN